MRWTHRTALAVVAAVLCLPGAASETGVSPKGLSVPQLYEFLLAENRSTVLHEVGHALVDIASLPAVGNEEDVADEFAMMVMIEDAKRSERGQKQAEAAGLAYIATADARRDAEAKATAAGYPPDKLDELFDEHTVNEQRAYRALSLLYGAFPDRYGAIADRLGMTEGQRANAIRDFERKAKVWSALLAPLAPKEAQASFSVTYEPVQPTGRFYQNSYVRFWYFDSWVADVLSIYIALPSPLQILVGECKEANAFYSPEHRAIVFCIEYTDAMADAVVLSRTGLTYDTWWSEQLQKRADPAYVGSWTMTSVAGLGGDPVRTPQELVLNADGTYRFAIRFSQDGSGIVRPDRESSGIWGVEDGKLWRIETGWSPDDPTCLHSGCELDATLNGVEPISGPAFLVDADTFDFNNGIIFKRMPAAP